jgi:hypothetical protein
MDTWKQYVGAQRRNSETADPLLHSQNIFGLRMTQIMITSFIKILVSLTVLLNSICCEPLTRCLFSCRFAVSKFEALVPVIMEKLQSQTKTHPFFEAELALSIDTAGRETEDPQNIAVVARHSDSTFLVHVPLKFVGQPICESASLTVYDNSRRAVGFISIVNNTAFFGTELRGGANINSILHFFFRFQLR